MVHNLVAIGGAFWGTKALQPSRTPPFHPSHVVTHKHLSPTPGVGPQKLRWNSFTAWRWGVSREGGGEDEVVRLARNWN